MIRERQTIIISINYETTVTVTVDFVNRNSTEEGPGFITPNQLLSQE